MCGIYGIVDFRRPLDVAEPVADAMAEQLVHRGPDGSGRHRDDHALLGIRLLNIVDPKAETNQPFVDPQSGVSVVCNGEIYNTSELRRRYDTYPFATASDVEPLLPLYLDRGPNAFTDVYGMFAVAVWDPRSRILVLTRDRAGEKPLFYTIHGDRCIFASEIQAILAYPGTARSVNAEALDDLATFGYIIGSKTMFAGVDQVAAGSTRRIDARPTGVTGTEQPYWLPRPYDTQPRADTLAELDALLDSAIAAQCTADVPVGVFLSGGIDSALIASYVSERSAPRRTHTFSIGFDEPTYDERTHARHLAKRFKTQHVTCVATNHDLAAALPEIVTRVAEPLTDPAALPTLILAREASQHVGVVLTGEGADELFGGYPTYPGHRIARWFTTLPDGVQRALAHWVGNRPIRDTRVPLTWLLRRLVDGARLPLLERHVAWFGMGEGSTALSTEVHALWDETDGLDSLTRLMLFDYRTYLGSRLLPKIDRTTMLASLEARAPFLDPALTRFALALPDTAKVSGLTTKRLLKRLASRRLPGRTVRRRKQGLSVPINQLMAGDLRADFERQVRDERFEPLGLLPPGRVSELVSQHRSRTTDHGRTLWALLVFGMWAEHWIGV